MKHHTKKRKGFLYFKRACIFLSVAIGLLLFFVLSLGAYVYHHIDYTADEALFEAAKGDRVSRLYYNINTNGEQYSLQRIKGLASGYTPLEWEEQRIVGDEDGFFCRYDDIPEELKCAFVAIEDKRFFAHEGVDWWRTIKAALNYLLHFDGRFGGSSITQQVIKNISSDDELTISRKVREICRAIHLEKNHSKQEILELYMNIAPMSGRCVGIGAAAKQYFGKDVGELTLSECASIAAVTNSPVRYDPITNPENNRKRRDVILSQMKKQGMIGEEECRAAQALPVATVAKKQRSATIYSWYTETVAGDVVHDLMQEYGYSRAAAERMVYGGGLSIYTQMNKKAQDYLESYFADQTHFQTEFRNGLCMSMVITDPRTGDLLAIVGGVGRKTENRSLHYALTLRPPGSAIKPLSVYAPALEEGIITWASVFDDVPVSFLKGERGYTAWPHNSPAVYSGLTDVQTAVALSKNTVAVRVLKELGKERSFSYLTDKMGLSTLVLAKETADGKQITDLAAAPLALGQLTDGVSLRALVGAYSALAGGGEYRAPRSYSLVLDRHGKILLSKSAQKTRVFSRENAYITTELLRTVAEEGTAASLTLKKKLPVAAKTGTSGNTRDKWLVGYTPYALAGVWCGYENGSTSVPKGAQMAHMAVWDAVMTELHEQGVFGKEARTNVFSVPPGIVRVAYCRDSGNVPCEACHADPRGERISYGYFLRGTEPKESCNRHVPVMYDEIGGGIATELCPEENQKLVGLLSKFDRNFPAEVYIADAQYEYWPTKEQEDTLQDAPIYHGKSNVKDGEAYNRLCPGEHLPKTWGDTVDPFAFFRRYFKKGRKSS